jgi:5-formyltetrahydrofolate cyclo-ligase
MPELQAAKDRVRREALQRRDQMTADERRAYSAAVQRRFVHLASVRSAHTLFCFVSFRTEVDTLGILRWALRRGLTLAVPRIEGPRRMVAVRITSLDDLRPGHWGIPEPLTGLPLVSPRNIDVAALPGAAFDADGGRVGYGGGFYDTFLAELSPSAVLVALSFEGQIVGCVPCEDHDRRAHLIVTERRVWRCDRACSA